ncbi:MAG: hypothetical protein KA748_16750 [Halomonas sp.]|nr:hypothetical protein [Halomonas sp.]MBP5981841.1 hypothetical protein [Halomonas sp.]
MSSIIDFKPHSQLEASAQLDAFIVWAKATLAKGVPNKRVHAGIRWDMNSWHNSGVQGCTFTVHGLNRNAKAKDKKYMQPPFIDFAKALIVHYKVFRGKKLAKNWLLVAKVLEVALVDLSGGRDVTRTSAAICNRTCEYFKNKYPNGNTAYTFSKILEHIVQLMSDKKLLAKPFRWTSPLRRKYSSTLKEQRANRDTKMPSRESILALGELFNNDLASSLDIITTTACALLLSQPSRIGELVDVEHDCVVFKEGADGGRRMFLRWYAEKGFGATIKPVMTGMESVVERAINLLVPVTEEARAYAAFLENHPDEFPPHEGMPLKGPDEPLSYGEACAALKVRSCPQKSVRKMFKTILIDALAKRKALSPEAQVELDEIREGWDTSSGKRIYVNGRLNQYHFNDRAVITLRKLNILMREKYLSKDFPYTSPAEDGKKRVKYRDALFTVRTGSLHDETKKFSGIQLDFGVEIAASPTRIAAQLGGATPRKQSIFQRHGYGNLKVNSHAFRHELNTEMHKAGLSQLLIDAFSGRTAMGSVYNHETVEERTQRVAHYHPKTKHRNVAQRLEKVKTNQPLSLSDVTDLHEGDQDRVIHQTHVGICVHNFASEPCPKMGACLSCGRLGCVKGDDVKLVNLKEEREDLKRRYDKALDAQSRDIFGASEWAKKVGMNLYKCDALIRTLENPELENGDIAWNVDNGWTLSNNAAVMAGLIDSKDIETKNEQLLPLDDLSAMLD